MNEINTQPIAPIEPVIDNYFGTDVVDNYRYMENLNDPTVKKWVKAQADYTIETLSQLPGLKAFFDRMMELDASVPAKISGVLRLASGKIFYRKSGSHNDPSKLYMRSSLDSIVSPEIHNISDSGYAIAPFYDGTQRNIDIHISPLTTLIQNIPEWLKVCDANDEMVLSA